MNINNIKSKTIKGIYGEKVVQKQNVFVQCEVAGARDESGRCHY